MYSEYQNIAARTLEEENKLGTLKREEAFIEFKKYKKRFPRHYKEESL